MSPIAKALLRAMVTDHMLRARAGELKVDLSPRAVAEAHHLGIAPELIDRAAEELVEEGLCSQTDAGLRLLKSALEKTL